jgi:hypothetical protein
MFASASPKDTKKGLNKSGKMRRRRFCRRRQLRRRTGGTIVAAFDVSAGMLHDAFVGFFFLTHECDDFPSYPFHPHPHIYHSCSVLPAADSCCSKNDYGNGDDEFACFAAVAAVNSVIFVSAFAIFASAGKGKEKFPEAATAAATASTPLSFFPAPLIRRISLIQSLLPREWGLATRGRLRSWPKRRRIILAGRSRRRESMHTSSREGKRASEPNTGAYLVLLVQRRRGPAPTNRSRAPIVIEISSVPKQKGLRKTSKGYLA